MRTTHFYKLFVVTILLVILCQRAYSQSWGVGQENKYNPITTAVPFLTIAPDSRHGSMGDVGAATSTDANAQFWNPSKLAFAKDSFGISLSYTPWLRQLVDDINLAYLAAYYKLDQNQAIGASIRYFSLGDIQLTDQNGSSLANVSPNEFSIDFSYSRKLSDVFSGGVSLRYIRSDLSGGISTTDTYVAGQTFATDVSFLFSKNFGASDNDQNISAGINLSNIGGKISYDQGQNKEFLPANLKLGTTYSKVMNDYHSFSVSFDFNKLMVPTPQVSKVDPIGQIVLPENTNNKSVIESIFTSFSDAPGGAREEFQEINWQTGIEYIYKQQFALRGGYFHESEYKGNRKFFATGVGVKMNICTIDFSYLIPTQQNNPLANTIRFTLLFNLSSFKKSKSPAAI